MFSRIKKIIEHIKNLNHSVDSYKKDSIIQSLPTVAYVNKAKKLLEHKEYDKAESLLKEALDISNQDALVYKYLGRISEIKMQMPKAAEYYENSSRINPQDKDVWLRLGMCQLNCKKYEESINSFEKADKITPMNTDVQTGWGMALMRLKKYALARDKFVFASKISKYNYTAILLSAVMEIRLCDYKSAEEKLSFLTKVAPNESSTYEYAALKLLKSDYKDAEKLAKKSLSYNKQMLPSYFILGEIYSLQKNAEKTEQIFNEALKNDLDSDSLQFEWGKACVRLFDFSSAKEHFNLSIEKTPDNLNAKIGLALILALEDDFSILNELKEKHGDNVYIQESLGLYYFSNEKYQDAVEMFKKALRTDAKQVYNYLHLARAYQKLNKNDKVREYFEKFIIENPHYKAGIIEYSKWLIEISDFADAKRKLQKIEKISVADSEVHNLLFYCSYKLAISNICEYNVEEAISIANKTIALGDFRHEPEKQELEKILKEIKG